ncbi:MAG: alpha-galactosidase [Ruminococcaceae bacterium]|nr:alpha-galactosidase [Oscillospiraceae bacterium]
MEYQVSAMDSAKVELTESNENGISFVTLKANFTGENAPEALRVSFSIPSCDCYSTWSPSVRFNRTLAPNWCSKRTNAKLASWMPVHQIVSLGGENRITIAVSDTATPTEIKTGISEEDARVMCSVGFFTEQTTPIEYYEAKIRIDTRPIAYYDSIYQVVDWWEQDCGYTPAAVPEAARLPMDSLWYSFHQNLQYDSIVEECKLSKAMGMETVIIDDGWQTDDNHRGYKYCGDWELATGKIPDMEKLVADIHAIGMKVMLWFAMPYVGVCSKNYKRFEDKCLYANEKFLVLDPRCPEVCDFLVDTYKTAVRNWKLDGLKLDFIDAFTLKPESKTRMDISLEAAVDGLMVRIREELLTVNPDILIEFRQGYIGPSIRKYGNMLRVGDCPNDPLVNRGDIVNMRLTSGKTPVHSDMIMWNREEKVEDAALHIIPALVGVPQISMRIDQLSQEHKKMLKFYLDFWKENRAVLLDGKLIADNPETNYSQVKAVSQSSEIVTVYENVVVDVRRPVCKIINASKLGFVIVKNAANRNYRVVNCMGEILTQGRIENNLTEIKMPASAILTVEA